MQSIPDPATHQQQLLADHSNQQSQAGQSQPQQLPDIPSAFALPVEERVKIAPPLPPPPSAEAKSQGDPPPFRGKEVPLWRKLVNEYKWVIIGVAVLIIVLVGAGVATILVLKSKANTSDPALNFTPMSAGPTTMSFSSSVLPNVPPTPSTTPSEPSSTGAPGQNASFVPPGTIFQLQLTGTGNCLSVRGSGSLEECESTPTLTDSLQLLRVTNYNRDGYPGWKSVATSQCLSFFGFVKAVFPIN